MDRQVGEDERGVDRESIRAQLRMTPAERVQWLVEQVRVWTEILGAAAESRTRDV